MWTVTSGVPLSQNMTISLYMWVDGGIHILSQRHFKTQVETKMTPNKTDSNNSTILSQSSQMSLRHSTGFVSFGMVIWEKAWELNLGRVRWSDVSLPPPLKQTFKNIVLYNVHYIFLSRVCIGWPQESSVVIQSKLEKIFSIAFTSKHRIVFYGHLPREKCKKMLCVFTPISQLFDNKIGERN